MSALVPATTSTAPPLLLVGGKAVTSSRDVAASFGKRHDNILRDIRGLLKSEETPEAGALFTLSTYIDDQNGRSYEHYLMDRDGFVLLVMGFTGDKAIRWKLDYMRAFNAMEEEIRRRQAPAFDPNDPASLRLVLLGYAEANIALKAENAEMSAELSVAAPKAAFYDEFADADGLYGLHNAARALSAPPQGFTDWLKGRFLFYQGRELMPRSEFVKHGIFHVKVRMVDEKARSRTFITPRGLQYLAKPWQRHLLKTKGGGGSGSGSPQANLFEAA